MNDESSRVGIALPAPTPWPMLLALGVALLGAGYLMHPLLAVIGFAVVCVGCVGWFRDVLPVEQEEIVPVVEPEEMLGRWRGSGLPTGSPLDGMLEGFGWYGKEFLDEENVHPLLFADRNGQPRPVDPGLLPVGVLRDYAGFLDVWPVRRGV